MSNDEDISRLEQFVENLLTSYNELKKEHQALELRLQESEEQGRELREKLSGLQDERRVMRGRVTGLLDRIEAWEKAGEAPPAEQPGPEKGPALGEPGVENSMPIFSAGAGSET